MRHCPLFGQCLCMAAAYCMWVLFHYIILWITLDLKHSRLPWKMQWHFWDANHFLDSVILSSLANNAIHSGVTRLTTFYWSFIQFGFFVKPPHHSCREHILWTSCHVEHVKKTHLKKATAQWHLFISVHLLRAQCWHIPTTIWVSLWSVNSNKNADTIFTEAVVSFPWSVFRYRVQKRIIIFV